MVQSGVQHARRVADDVPPLSQQEIASLLALVTVIGGQAMAGRLPLDVVLHLRQRLVRAGVLEPGHPVDTVWEVVEALAQPLHLLTGPDAPAGPPQAELPVENVVAFADATTAHDFVDELRIQGEDVDAPVHEEDYRRWTVVIRGQRRPDGRSSAPVGVVAAAAIERGGWHLGAQS